MTKKKPRFQVRVVLWHDYFTGFKFNNAGHKQNLAEIQKRHFAYNKNIVIILLSKMRT